MEDIKRLKPISDDPKDIIATEIFNLIKDRVWGKVWVKFIDGVLNVTISNDHHDINWRCCVYYVLDRVFTGEKSSEIAYQILDDYRKYLKREFLK